VILPAAASIATVNTISAWTRPWHTRQNRTCSSTCSARYLGSRRKVYSSKTESDKWRTRTTIADSKAEWEWCVRFALVARMGHGDALQAAAASAPAPNVTRIATAIIRCMDPKRSSDICVLRKSLNGRLVGRSPETHESFVLRFAGAKLLTGYSPWGTHEHRLVAIQRERNFRSVWPFYSHRYPSLRPK